MHRSNLMKASMRLAAMAMAGLIAACGQDPSTSTDAPPAPRPVNQRTMVNPEVARVSVQGEKHIGVCLPGVRREYEDALRKGLNSVAGPFGFVLSFESADGQVEDQIRHLREFQLQRLDAIAVSPLPGVEVQTVITELCEAGIPVFTLGSPTSLPCVTSHIGSDDVMAGKLAGGYVARKLQGKGIVGTSPSKAQSFQDQEREKGFRETLAARAEVEYSTSYNMMDFCFIMNDMPLWASSIKEEIPRMIGFSVPKQKEHNNVLDAVILEYPEEMGEKAIQAMADHFAGKPVAKTVLVRVKLEENRALENVAAQE